jgi:hypothetical protein
MAVLRRAPHEVGPPPLVAFRATNELRPFVGAAAPPRRGPRGEGLSRSRVAARVVASGEDLLALGRQRSSTFHPAFCARIAWT